MKLQQTLSCTIDVFASPAPVPQILLPFFTMTASVPEKTGHNIHSLQFSMTQRKSLPTELSRNIGKLPKQEKILKIGWAKEKLKRWNNYIICSPTAGTSSS